MYGFCSRTCSEGNLMRIVIVLTAVINSLALYTSRWEANWKTKRLFERPSSRSTPDSTITTPKLSPTFAMRISIHGRWVGKVDKPWRSGSSKWFPTRAPELQKRQERSGSLSSHRCGYSKVPARALRGAGEDGKAEPPQEQLFLRIFVKKDGRWLLRGFFPRPAMDD